MQLTLLSWVAIFVSGTFGQPAYDYDCAYSFDPRDSRIFVHQYGGPTSCFWKFTAHEGETFQLTFKDFGVDQQSADCSKHYVTVRDGYEELKHCGRINTPYKITTSGHTLTIRFWKNNINDNFYIDANLKIAMTWSDAEANCKQNGGYIARSFPVVPQKLKNLIRRTYKHNNNNEYWIGKSLTPWVSLLGCVRWDRNKVKNAVYKKSKYNQMSECATACRGSASFMLQRNSCYCLNEEEKRGVKYVPYIKCDEPCPGQSREKCGGINVFTFYDYYHGQVAEANDMYNCVFQTEEPHNTQSYNKQCHCDEELGFTCKLINGSEVTFNKDLPRRKTAHSLYKAIDFCARLSGGLGMSPLPKYPKPYYKEKYWTTITRAVDWNYDSVSQRRPDFSSVPTLDYRGIYLETFRNTSKKHRFICQYDIVSCGQNVSADDGNITSPNYPLEYKNGQVCEWQITVNDSKIIQLVIADMDLENSQDCIYDYLLVVENTTSERLCGRRRKQYILTKYNTVNIVFRSDDTLTGAGFTLLWSAVDRSISTYPTTSSDGEFGKSSEQKSLSGGAIVGITVAVAAFCVLMAAFLACVFYRKTHPTRTVQDHEETSTAHNLVYAISSFNTGSSFNDEDNKAYENVSQKRRENLRAEASYANDPSRSVESSGNIYLTINYGNNDVMGDVSTDAGSKANLLLDSDSSATDTIDSRTTREKKNMQPKEASGSGTDEATGAEQPYTDITDTSNIDDIGKECIKVESTKNIVDSGQESSVAYTDVVFERSVNPPETKEEDGYLNAGLSSNAKMPHYEDIESSECVLNGAHKTGTDVKKENDASNSYLEL
ncbi:uncharacterized protein LOC123561694 isoform X3 [Mercenaria mercenaria]|uniref:uncharacterized protein LOC123561694 isoform X3 n=1 Tax=Mercenaria mercenaria TaxID=6596 RepID=UPI00234F2625|nr:uncharacterized protein LOC123561694 isoform X3 [Mercenaria mercenaria]